MKINTNWKKYRNVTSDIRETRIRDWNGNPLYRSKINIADKRNLIEAFKTEAEICGIGNYVKVEPFKKELEKIKVIMEKKKEEDREKVKKLLSNNEKSI